MRGIGGKASVPFPLPSMYAVYGKPCNQYHSWHEFHADPLTIVNGDTQQCMKPVQAYLFYAACGNSGRKK